MVKEETCGENKLEEMTDILTGLHEVLLSILVEFDRICRKHNIRYSLSYGTLLGAIRHKGFIPWDDDVDIMMTRDNYDKFLSVCESDLKPEFFLQTKYTEAAYPYNIARLRKNNTAMIYGVWRSAGFHQGIYIDICPVDNIADNVFLRSLQYLGIICGTVVRVSKNPSIFFGGGKKFGNSLKKILFCLCKIVPQDFLLKVEEKSIRRYNKDKTKMMGIICEGGVLIKTPRDMMPFSTEVFKDYREVIFENHSFMSVADTDRILKHWYGDYMQLPPPEERVIYHKPDILDLDKSYEFFVK